MSQQPKTNMERGWDAYERFIAERGSSLNEEEPGSVFAAGYMCGEADSARRVHNLMVANDLQGLADWIDQWSRYFK